MRFNRGSSIPPPIPATDGTIVHEAGKWLAIGLMANLLVSIAIVGWIVTRGETYEEGFAATAQAQVRHLLRASSDDDSWGPMLKAYKRKVENPKNNIYEIFFHDREKFQYPPSSLILFDFLPRSMTGLVDGHVGTPLLRIFSWLSVAAVLLTVIASALILEICLKRFSVVQPAGSGGMALRVMLSLALGLTYYPLLKGHEIGQIQVFLNAFVAFAVLMKLLEREVFSGVLFGICCLVKPQYGVILVWSLLRRNWRLALGFTGILLAGITVSIARFGWDDHFTYLNVLSEISRLGEAYWPNQSVNGLLNRLRESATPTRFSASRFAPYHPVVHMATLFSSIVILTLALWHRGRNRRAEGNSFDLMVALVAASLASPIAWEHHYGAFLPVFAIALPGLIHFRPLGRATAPLFLLSYVLMAEVMLRPELIFRNRWAGLAGSHLFFGVLILFAILLVLRAESTRQEAAYV